ncbi:C40 family peptidase [Patiriisocius marinus]|uniref:Lipoprotein n=1 Tax=Patiriisocius marinus TaxID=1397112 RepID=A0A5J4J136_9FLAO|nr:C40 family peptidase [Patiriisocius marinus]GER58187.1 lipoprotein [Patiriisocius marinus]
MKRLLPLILLLLLITSCGSSKSTSNNTYKKERTSSRTSHKAASNNIIDYARTFRGTRYKYGGTTSRGMDCSGLVYVSFGNENIQMPRVSREMAKRGTKISLSNVAEGDLVFFRTNKNSRNINHVGIVTETNGGGIKFIHSTTSKGVIESSLDERYWKNAFVQARKIL